MAYPTRVFTADPFGILRSGLSGLPSTYPGRTAAFPRLCIWRTEDGAAIAAEMPGVDPAEVDITVKDNVLSLAGERTQTDFGADARWLRRERSYGRFTRAVSLPFRIDPERIDARYENGILFITAALSDADKPRKIEIKTA